MILSTCNIVYACIYETAIGKYILNFLYNVLHQPQWRNQYGFGPGRPDSPNPTKLLLQAIRQKYLNCQGGF